jgi:hypothetical protein
LWQSGRTSVHECAGELRQIPAILQQQCKQFSPTNDDGRLDYMAFIVTTTWNKFEKIDQFTK